MTLLLKSIDKLVIRRITAYLLKYIFRSLIELKANNRVSGSNENCISRLRVLKQNVARKYIVLTHVYVDKCALIFALIVIILCTAGIQNHTHVPLLARLQNLKEIRCFSFLIITLVFLPAIQTVEIFFSKFSETCGVTCRLNHARGKLNREKCLLIDQLRNMLYLLPTINTNSNCNAT
jgi:hypothetical protein